MLTPKRFDVGYSVGFLYAYLGLTIPHSVAVNLAYPSEVAVIGELLLWSLCTRGASVDCRDATRPCGCMW